MIQKYRPIPVQDLAKAMIKAAMDVTPGLKEYESEAVFALTA